MSRHINGADRAQREMRRARATLERDLILANSGQIGRSRMPDYLGGGGDTGESLWFLSPVDPASGQTAPARGLTGAEGGIIPGAPSGLGGKP